MTLIIILRLIYEAYFRFPHFKILRVGVRKWIHKSPEHFFTYQIELKMKKPSSELIFEELWIDEKRYKFHLSRENRMITGSFDKKEKLKLNVVSEIKNMPALPKNNRNSKGRLLLGYTFRNKRKYISFRKFMPMDDLRIIGSFK